MYKVDKAIIMAAGEGTRMRPLTLHTPKPLISVNGTPMIENIIQSLHKNEIKEIYIVVGYLKEKFEYLKSKYSNITIINNPYYNTCNNISSLYVARNFIDNSIILDGDQIIFNDDILTPYFYKSGYNVIWTDNHTTEWLLTVKNNTIVHCNREGGESGWKLYSVSRWNSEDGNKLKRHIEIEFENNNNQIYWDDVAMFCYPEEYSLVIIEMNENDILEIDNIDELIAVDNSYIEYKKEGIYER